MERAASEGYQLDDALDVSKITPKVKGQSKKHKKRAAFKFSEVQAVFGHTLWQGAQSKGRRHVPGNVITKDCRFWIPLILQYTGARRAEIAGLLSSDIQVREGYDCIVIHANKYRGIKGEDPGETDEALKLTRVVPIHPHLIELGFLEYAQEMQKEDSPLLFPDVVPTPRKGSKRSLAPDPEMHVDKFGESIDDIWRNGLKHALNGNPRKLCMHSLGHYVNNFFLFSKDVSALVRLAIVGHVDNDKEDTNTDVYRDDAPMELKVKAIRMLPRAF
ncbi:hypothetical protein [Nereida sp. MMG025]|uniref:hypothetical protein n=1 Tax=Nereida sp. MMG025 TaxID=2909981 RepID=UPI001F2D9D32|nr:hypothetical protein [Nereida sp. MMG025]MCF6443159.1 hypothetical protein [Nereida sp. MMG025]